MPFDEVTPGHQLLVVPTATGKHVFVVLFKLFNEGRAPTEAMVEEVAVGGTIPLDSKASLLRSL